MAIPAVKPAPERLFLGRDAAAEALDVSVRTIDDAIRKGELRAYRVGRRVLVCRDALIRYARSVAVVK
jgi:excisionase family DNA binding protein